MKLSEELQRCAETAGTPEAGFDRGHVSDLACWAEQARATESEVERLRGVERWYVEHAADEKLDGYRELGARAAAAENRLDAYRAAVTELREGTQRYAMAGQYYMLAIDVLGVLNKLSDELDDFGVRK